MKSMLPTVSKLLTSLPDTIKCILLPRAPIPSLNYLCAHNIHLNHFQIALPDDFNHLMNLPSKKSPSPDGIYLKFY